SRCAFTLRPTSLALFPYTTLFRSRGRAEDRSRSSESPFLSDGVIRQKDARPSRRHVGGVTDLQAQSLPPLRQHLDLQGQVALQGDRKSTRLNSSHEWISYAVFCLK